MNPNDRIMRVFSLRDRITAAAAASPDLLKPEYREKVEAGAHPLTGHCYVASEAFYHAASDLEMDLYPETVKVSGYPGTHWRVRSRAFPDVVIDLTEAQFWSGDGPTPEYTGARGRGFLTKKPSKRAQELLKRSGLQWEDPDVG